jgi:CheY-like chemotaxis protein
LVGLRILVVEDEALLSMLVQDALADLGCTVLGPFMRLDAATPVVLDGSQTIDLAMLDLEVGGEWSFPLAELLLDRDVPVIFATGHDDAAIDERWRAAPRLRKPFSDEDLKRIVAEVAGARSG